MGAELLPPTHAALAADFEIIREIGRGGTALVYLATERATGAEVAIKLIRAKYVEDDEALARFAREARFVTQLNHPNIVPVRAVIDLGSAGLALVMAHVAGRTLKQVIRAEHPISPERVEQMLRDVGGGLGAAHAMGIVHRDVKPENIFVDGGGRALLADFGLARSMTTDTQLTMAGVAIGTPSYMAPEQIDGGQLDARGDIYSLGLVAWEALTGRRPWENESLYAVLYHQKYDQLPDVRDVRADVPDYLADAIAGSIEKDREARWQSVGELMTVLDNRVAVRRVVRHAPVANDTIQFARQGTGAALASVAAELDAARSMAARRPARRAVSVGGALVTLAIIALVATASRGGRSNDPLTLVPRAATSDGEIGDTGGLTAPALQSRPTAPVALDTAAVTTLGGARQNGVPSGNAAAPVVTPPAAATVVAPPQVSSAPADKPRAMAVRPFDSSAAGPGIGPAPSAPRLETERANISAGGMHSCLISASGRVFCWGANDYGQVGNGATGRAPAPVVIGGDVRFTAVTAGLTHSCAISRAGAAWCWGENDHGQLGDRSRAPRALPARVADDHVFHTIVAGASHSCGLDMAGVAWCWGSNRHGQLGIGDGALADSDVPVAVTGGRRFTSIAAGWNFTCAIGDGHAFCWGDDAAGELGNDASRTEQHRPVPVSGAHTFVSIAAGNAHACGVTTEGDAYCWGRNSSGQLGDGTTTDHATPARVKSAARFAAITAGAVHTCAVTTEGDAYCWGQNGYGQLGDGATTDRNQPVQVAGAHTFALVRAFGSHTCGMTTSGDAFCWGYNLDGELGDGTRTHRARPVFVEPPSGG